jgi:flagellum-specific peptidoglycan hydrolase FlgJ
MNTHREFIRAMLAPAKAAIGKQHGWLVRWAIAKAAQECGWSLSNILIQAANNCLGIKAMDGDGRPIAGVPHYIKADSVADGRDDGTVYWRKFDSLEACFAEFVRQLNDRSGYQVFRNAAIVCFENIYTDNLKGHPEAVLMKYHEVTAELQGMGLADEKGRIKS